VCVCVRVRVGGAHTPLPLPHFCLLPQGNILCVCGVVVGWSDGEKGVDPARSLESKPMVFTVKVVRFPP
jgi:hypothetical protein